MRTLYVAEYDQAEEDALLRLPNRIVEAFQPVHFQMVGYPTRIRQERELFKYIDVLHELGFEHDFVNLLRGLSEEEFALLKRLTELIVAFSESHFGFKTLAKSSLLRSINVLRHIKYLYGEDRPRIFEIGPGCGYLGAMLMLEGYPYAATDVSQAFYLYQNHFWNFISDGQVVELATDSTLGDHLPAPVSGGAVHIPWWKFVELELRDIPGFDVISCNHVLCEMHPSCLSFSLHVAQSLLERADDPLMVFEGWGSSVRNSRGSVTETIYRRGFGIVHHDPMITIISPMDSNLAVEWLSLPAKNSKIVRRGRNLMRRLKGQAPAHLFDPHHYIAESNSATKAVFNGRASQARTVDLIQTEKYFRGLVDDRNYLTPDEKFSLMVGRQ